jgi:hypothetical protein
VLHERKAKGKSKKQKAKSKRQKAKKAKAKTGTKEVVLGRLRDRQIDACQAAPSTHA